MTVKELREKTKRLGLTGYSRMDKLQLEGFITLFLSFPPMIKQFTLQAKTQTHLRLRFAIGCRKQATSRILTRFTEYFRYSMIYIHHA